MCYSKHSVFIEKDLAMEWDWKIVLLCGLSLLTILAFLTAFREAEDALERKNWGLGALRTAWLVVVGISMWAIMHITLTLAGWLPL